MSQTGSQQMAWSIPLVVFIFIHILRKKNILETDTLSDRITNKREAAPNMHYIHITIITISMAIESTSLKIIITLLGVDE